MHYFCPKLIFQNFPQKYESDVEIGEFYSNGTIYFDDARLAQEKVIEMVIILKKTVLIKNI